MDWLRTLVAKGAAPLALAHLRQRRHAAGAMALHCVLIDQSASMLRGHQLAWAKGCLLALTEQVYQRRERLAVIGFGGTDARLLQAPGKVAAFNAAWIAPLGGGGATPIEAALRMLSDVMARDAKRTPAPVTLWLLTDGRFDPLPERPPHIDACHIVDFEGDGLRLRRCAQLAKAWDARLSQAHDWQP